jgi:ERF superfamily
MSIGAMNEIVQGEIVAGQDITPMDLVRRAILTGAGVEVLDRLMALHERYEQFKAHKSYSAAIADAKAEFGPINKSQLVNFVNRQGQRTRYWHESMSDIADAIDKPLSKYGLSYRWHTESDIKNGSVRITCIVSHRDGYSVENSLAGAFDVSGGKNPIQAVGSVCTYLERYTLKAALGLVPDDDDDAQSVTPEDPPSKDERDQFNRDAMRPRSARQDPPPPPRLEPYSVEPPTDIQSNEAWHTWAGEFGQAVRKSIRVDEIDKWIDVNRDLLVQMKDLEPKLYESMSGWITQRRMELLKRPPT